ncbi:hypothetical protein [Weissella cibaria]|uniref:hypothetical protein n=1 Tax=Weissella cibaria TaxID=137591 RepID=UPI00106E9C28|nr:hypothetical protein [Weissella cibaria]
MLVVANDAVTEAKAEAEKVLSDAVSDAMKQSDVSLAVIQADIEQIKDDISQIRAIATKNWIIKRLRVSFRMLICN